MSRPNALSILSPSIVQVSSTFISPSGKKASRANVIECPSRTASSSGVSPSVTSMSSPVISSVTPASGVSCSISRSFSPNIIEPEDSIVSNTRRTLVGDPSSAARTVSSVTTERVCSLLMPPGPRSCCSPSISTNDSVVSIEKVVSVSIRSVRSVLYSVARPALSGSNRVESAISLYCMRFLGRG